MVTIGFVRLDPNGSIFAASLSSWIITFYSVVRRDPKYTHHRPSGPASLAHRSSSARFRLGQGVFIHVILILMESAALYLFVALLVLVLYSINYNAQFIVLETAPHPAGITFGLVTIRVIVRSQELSHSSVSKLNDGPVTGMPMRRIAVNITTHLEHDSPDSQHRSTESKLSPV
ncbi:hypothetical protein B0H16DRAFT_1719140 [Mycena metata]|uniref:Uncharacterized protein n=1 Tax=Mycena metata TaxID=1033252 RepID=A0AAD7JD46_9AGAR|nr:hypothetical protein B0H16DRAFT_1719140 [Mycena metata]